MSSDSVSNMIQSTGLSASHTQPSLSTHGEATICRQRSVNMDGRPSKAVMPSTSGTTEPRKTGRRPITKKPSS